tara:strand:- start:115795 stop:116094 length:300 start_codon:yes stop_codon:yes gene_type:complete
MEETNVNNLLKHYIDAAMIGHNTLFFEDWLKEHKWDRTIAYRTANKNVRDTFKKLSRHRSTDRKKIALTSLDKNEREIFINSFYRVVEHNLLKDLKSLH